MNTSGVSPAEIAVIGIAVLAVILGLLLVARKRKSDRLKERFGPEYDRLVRETGDARSAETALAAREKRVEKYEIRALPEGDRQEYAADWAEVQRRFVDDPALSVVEADRLVTRLMDAKGYPMADFEQRAADVSVSYPGVVANYRSARTIVVRQAAGQATTEDLRQAMVYYRSLFEELLGHLQTESRGVTRERIAS